MGIINSGAPIVYSRGTEDNSPRTVPFGSDDYGQHICKVYIYSARGKPGQYLLDGPQAKRFYGSKTFDPVHKYYNFSTVAADLCLGKANKVMFDRIIPTDAKQAKLMLWLKVTLQDVDVLKRDPVTGAVIKDNAGNTTVDHQVPGAKVEWVSTTTDDDWDTIKQYGIVSADPNDPNSPKMYPVFAAILDHGEDGNNYGIRLWASSGDEFNQSLYNKQHINAFNLAIIKREDEFSSPKVVKTIFGEENIEVTFKENTANPITGQSMYIGDAIETAYKNTTDPRYDLNYGTFAETYVFSNYIKAAMEELGALEGAVTDQPYSDIHTIPVNKRSFALNVIDGKTPAGVPYAAIDFSNPTDPNKVSLFRYANLWASGGNDGTMSDAEFNIAVRTKLDDYADESAEVQDIALHVEKVMYDTGFEIETKKKMLNFIALRKNTVLGLSTYTSGSKELSPSEEYSLAVALFTQAKLQPESVYYGTEAVRCAIFGHSCELRNHPYKKRLPLIVDIIEKGAEYMGASNGKWRKGFSFDRAPRSVIRNAKNVSMPWIPNSNRKRNWDIGLNFSLTYRRDLKSWPALQTICTDDTSVLNSWFTVFAIAELNNIAHEAWREYRGNDTLTSEQLVANVNAYVSQRVNGKFDDRYVIKPKAYISGEDELRGFSWSFPIEIYANNMHTVMTTWVRAYRKSDLGG